MSGGLLSPLALVLVALGSALGGMARYWLGTTVDRRATSALPVGTMLVNLSGALVIGLLAVVVAAPSAEAFSPIWSAVITGFLGSYTTVSAFGLQTLVLLEKKRDGWALVHVSLSVGGCLAAAAAGMLIARSVLDVVV